MHDKLRSYVEELFAPAPKTNKVRELKEELLTNLQEKYLDLLASGKSEEDAYHSIISGIGDVDELINSLTVESVIGPAQKQKRRQKTATIITASVMLYFVALLVLIYGSIHYNPITVFCVALLICAISTGILTYHSLLKPNYLNLNRKAENRSNDRVVNRTISSCIWGIAGLAYLIIGLISHNWVTSWIVFLVALVVDSLARTVVVVKRKS